MSISIQQESLVVQAGMELPERVLPIYEYAVRTQPAAILVCDRDARPIGAALEAIDAERGELALTEETLLYRRISKRLPSQILIDHLRDPLQRLQAESTDADHLMIVDDYVSNSAGTLCLFNESSRKLGVTMPIEWVTMSGRGTAFNVFPNAGAATLAPWRDRPEVLGIDYDGIELQDRPTELSRFFYDAIRKGARNLRHKPPL